MSFSSCGVADFTPTYVTQILVPISTKVYINLFFHNSKPFEMGKGSGKGDAGSKEAVAPAQDMAGMKLILGVLTVRACPPFARVSGRQAPECNEGK